MHGILNESNTFFQWFKPRTLTDGFFRTSRRDRETVPSPSHQQLTGSVSCAVSFGGFFDDHLLTKAFDYMYAIQSQGPNKVSRCGV